MNGLKKQFFLALFIFSAGFFVAGSATAQTWTAVVPSVPNQCGSSITANENNCLCPQGYSYGTANNANCTMDGFVPGCWNPGTGKCNTCGEGGTIVLGQKACFGQGQTNAGGSNGNAVGIACTSSSQCANAGSSGGFSTN
jgi:hypothetical protein